ncbi:MAG: MacS family sensor histidine kinase [Pseudonocardiaceae bacterium]
MPVGTDLITPLWRGVVILRIVTAALAIGAIIVHHDGFARPGLGWAVLTGIAVWTVVTSLAYSFDVTRRIHTIVLDLVVTLALMASSVLVLSPDQLLEVTERTPLLTTVWASGPVVAAAVHAGRIAGVVFGVAVSAVNVWARGFFSTELTRDTVLLVGAGFVIGLAATTARRATEQLRRAARAEAAGAERDRLARSIHDGVLKVLAMVRVPDGPLDVDVAELSRLAREQEAALRSLLSADPAGAGSPGEEDLAAALRALAGPGVDITVPATEVPLPASDVEELVAITREALADTALHDGTATRFWVQVEDLDDEVVLTIRRDGPADEPPAAVAANGQAGATRSIRGRVADLGGTLTVDTRPGQGTEWKVELTRTRREQLQ